MSDIHDMMTPAEFQKSMAYRQQVRDEYETEMTYESITREIERLRQREGQLITQCDQLRMMNEKLRNILEIYLQADNRARNLMNGL